MKRLFRNLLSLSLVLPAATAFSATQDGISLMTHREKTDGWKLLFDGRSLQGWQPYPTFSTPATGDWTAKDGEISCPGVSSGWLATEETFSDFELTLQFRGNADVNSGVFLRSSKEGAPHKTGYELQIWDHQPDGYNTGSLVGYVKAQPAKILPDEWNSYDVTVRGDHFVVVLNGKPLLDTHDFAHASGHIGLQCGVGSKIEFRNIKIRETK